MIEFGFRSEKFKNETWIENLMFLTKQIHIVWKSLKDKAFSYYLLFTTLCLDLI